MYVVNAAISPPQPALIRERKRIAKSARLTLGGDQKNEGGDTGIQEQTDETVDGAPGRRGASADV